MAFDKNLDNELFSETINFETTRITVGVFAYNDGTPKLQISRENLKVSTQEYTFAKLGRMLKEEAEKVIPIMQKALDHMEASPAQEAPKEEGSEEEKKP
ncbi:hypothetical protein ACFL0W_06580 [Nanoarchaeota archaeon]